MPNGGNEADANLGKITVSGHTVHGIYGTGFDTNTGYKSGQSSGSVSPGKGVATGDQPEAMYSVLDGMRYVDKCCFD